MHPGLLAWQDPSCSATAAMVLGAFTLSASDENKVGVSRCIIGAHQEHPK